MLVCLQTSQPPPLLVGKGPYLAMALRRLLSVAAAARLPGNCAPSSLAPAEELGSAALRWPLQPAWLKFAARLAQSQPMHTSAPAMHAADASLPAPAATTTPHEHPGGAAELHAAGSDAQSNPLGWAPPPSGATEGESSHEQGPPTRSITRAELRTLRKEAAGEAESSLKGGSETESARMAGPSATSPTSAAGYRQTDVRGEAESSPTGRLPLPSETSAPGRGGLWAGSSRKRPPRGTAPPEPQPPNPKHPFGGTRRSPPPAPSVGGIQAEALVGALGPPQFERIGKVTAGYSVERTPQFAIVELGAAQYKVRYSALLAGALPSHLIPACRQSLSFCQIFCAYQT